LVDDLRRLSSFFYVRYRQSAISFCSGNLSQAPIMTLPQKYLDSAFPPWPPFLVSSSCLQVTPVFFFLGIPKTPNRLNPLLSYSFLRSSAFLGVDTQLYLLSFGTFPPPPSFSPFFLASPISFIAPGKVLSHRRTVFWAIFT